MKKLLLAAAAALMSFTLSAQIFVGGSVVLNSNSTANNMTNPATTTKISAFTLSPNAGLILSDDLLVGARLNLMIGNSPAINQTDFGFGLNPYARYRLLEIGPFAILAEGGINFNTVTTKVITTNVGHQKDTDTSFGLYAEPVITYPLDDHITLEAALNVARVAFTTTKTKGNWHTDNPAGDTATADNSTTTFNLGADADNVIGGLGAIRIGFTYKF
ncbi:MAG: hypothetical protein J6X77_01855 [Bacteroidales bacterium]|nr:hypothetical protein [Bacteroidales bacterium]